MLLEGRRLLVTGVLTESSIAFSIARRAQEEGDGLVHAIAFVPGDALGGNFLTAPSESAVAAFQTSAFSLKALAAALLPLLERADEPGGAVVGLDFDAQVAWPAYDWAG